MEEITNQTYGGIYRIRNILNDKCYIGSAVNFYNRKKEHLSKLRRGLHHSKKLQNSFIKNGEESFVFEIVAVVENLDSLIETEQFFIDQYVAYAKGYNICPIAGSTRGRKTSFETIQKMKESRKFVSEETRKKRSESLKGRVTSEETKAKMRLAAKGRVITEEAKEKMRIAAKNRTKEVKEKIANAIRMSDIARGGRHSEEYKIKLSIKKKGVKLSESHKEAIKRSWEKRKANTQKES